MSEVDKREVEEVEKGEKAEKANGEPVETAVVVVK